MGVFDGWLHRWGVFSAFVLLPSSDYEKYQIECSFSQSFTNARTQTRGKYTQIRTHIPMQEHLEGRTVVITEAKIYVNRSLLSFPGTRAHSTDEHPPHHPLL